MRFALALFALWASACGPSAEVVGRNAVDAMIRADAKALGRWVDPSYADGRGGWTALQADAQSWGEAYLRREGQAELRAVPLGASRAVAEVDGTFVLRFDGDGPSLRAEGAVHLHLIRDGQLRVRSGLFTGVRDALALLAARRAALEANDVVGLAALIHPTYRDDGVDRTTLVEALERSIPGAVVRLTPLSHRIEVRSDLVHVDEHYRMTVDGRALPIAVARLTLARSAGQLRIQAGLN